MRVRGVRWYVDLRVGRAWSAYGGWGAVGDGKGCGSRGGGGGGWGGRGCDGLAREAGGGVWLLVGESGGGEVVVADHGEVVADEGGVVEEGNDVCVLASGRGEFAGIVEDEAVPVVVYVDRHGPVYIVNFWRKTIFSRKIVDGRTDSGWPERIVRDAQERLSM